MYEQDDLENPFHPTRSGTGAAAPHYQFNEMSMEAYEMDTPISGVDPSQITDQTRRNRYRLASRSSRDERRDPPPARDLAPPRAAAE